MITHKRETCYHCQTITPGERAFKDPASYCPACAARCRIPRNVEPPAYNQRAVSAVAMNHVYWREKGRAIHARVDLENVMNLLFRAEIMNETEIEVVTAAISEEGGVVDGIQQGIEWGRVAAEVSSDTEYNISPETAFATYHAALRKIGDYLSR